MPYCLYLRKSRADLEAEQHGELETLSRHENMLMDLARKRKLNVTKIFKEVVSGDTIAARPVMQQLLSEVENGCWEGVLVMEIERLARGDTIDQGIIAQTFKYSDTKIITPLKDYNPNNEFDEEYFEFGLFMSRREYKVINRRLQNGRIASVKEGKFVGNKTPFGYERQKIPHDKGYMLVVKPDEAEIVKMIFSLYVNGETVDGVHKNLGLSLIARKLNSLNILTKAGARWSQSTLQGLIRNPTYTGKVRWNFRKGEKKMIDGQVVETRPRNFDDCMVIDGLHEAIISEDLFQQAQEKLAKSKKRPPVKGSSVITNPLAGLVVCGCCGRKMVRRPYANGFRDSIMCPATKQLCDTTSAYLDIVEKKIIDSLAEWLEEYKVRWSNHEPTEVNKILETQKKQLKKCEAELETVEKQIDKAYDLLEQEIYDTDTFLKRSAALSERKQQLTAEKENIVSEINNSEKTIENLELIIPNIEEVLSTYYTLDSVKAKNDMLFKVLDKVVYTRTTRARKHDDPLDDFELAIYPKVPKDL